MENSSLVQNGSHNGAEKNGKSLHPPDYLAPTASASDAEDWNPSQLIAGLKRRILLIAGVTASTTALAWVVSVNQSPVYSGGFQLLVEPVTAQSQQDRDPLSDNPASDKNGLDYPTQIQVLLSPKTLEPIVSQIRKQYPDVTVSNLMAGLTVERPGETKLINVSYSDGDPQKIQTVVDALAEGYLNYSRKERESNLKQGISFVDRQIKETRKRVDSLQRQLQAFRQRNNVMTPDALGTQVSGQVQTITSQQLDLQKQIAETQRQYNSLQEREGAMAALAADSNYNSLLGKLRDIEVKLANESTRFQDGNAEMRVLRQQRDSLLPLLQQEARRVLGNRLAQISTELSVLSTREAALTRTEQYWNNEVQRSAVLSRQFSDLDRERTVATDSLNRFLATRENLQVEAAQQEVPWQLIAPPSVLPDATTSKQRNLIFGAIAGLLLGIGAALLSERVDGTLRTIGDLKKQTKLPLLGVIPLDSDSERWLPQAMTRNQTADLALDYRFVESFRTLYANISLLNHERDLKSLVVSSATSGDGKTTIATHLAQAAAAMGKRVLLVDANLRNPDLHHWLQLENTRGLSELIVQSLNPQDVIQQVPALAAVGGDDRIPPSERMSLSILTAGGLGVDSTRLLSSQKMKRLNEYFKAMYDLIIFDASSVLDFADSQLLASYTDGMILVSSLGRNDRADFKQALDNLRTARINVLGVVANRGQQSSQA